MRLHLLDPTIRGSDAAPLRPRRRDRSRRVLQELLGRADIRLDGDRPWDIKVRDARMIDAVLAHGSLGAGESYMDGWWDCEALDAMFTRVLRARVTEHLNSLDERMAALLAIVRNPQTPRRARRVGRQHYDLGDDVYQRMLDPRMIYSCAYWRADDSLASAQERKLDLVCRKLRLRAGMRVLDIGCGWGGAARFAAERYGVEVVGCTISQHQAQVARQRCDGLPVEIRLLDYRELDGQFDRIFSIGMFEHVGERNYRGFFSKARALLAADGLLLLHTIGSNRSSRATDAWIEKYIFANSMLPSIAQIGAATENLWVVEDWHSFGPHYDRTLMSWLENFEQHWPELASRYDERFHRMWRYYLASCAAAFRARHNQLWQVLLSPAGIAGGLPEVR
ncbi:MAG: cyclopropane fatty acyl phospholipid synthase [Steroidobacteraceae bacterium]